MTQPHHPPLSGEPPIEQHHPGLYRYLLRRLRGTADAEDLVQLIYLRFLQAPNLAAIRRPHAYLYRIASNVVGEYVLRRRSERVTYDSQLVDELTELSADVSTNDASEELHSAQVLRQVLMQLPAAHRSVLILYAQEGLQAEEIGERLDLDPQTVRKYLRQALARFRAAHWSSP